jgi:hypothetical protein
MVGNLGRPITCRCRAGTGDLRGTDDLPTLTHAEKNGLRKDMMMRWFAGLLANFSVRRAHAAGFLLVTIRSAAGFVNFLIVSTLLMSCLTAEELPSKPVGLVEGGGIDPCEGPHMA